MGKAVSGDMKRILTPDEVEARRAAVREMLAAGISYHEMRESLQVGARRFRRILASAGIERATGRPSTRPRGDRVSLERAGVL